MGHSYLAEKLEHISFGNVQGLSAKESNSRLLLGDILDQCQSAIRGLLEVDPENTQEFQGGDRLKVSDALGGIGLMAQDLSIKRGGNFSFDIAKMATTDGWTGLALEESYAKLSTKLNGAAIDRHELESMDYSLFEEKQAYTDVLRLLVQFPEIVKSSFKPLESSTVLALLYRIVDSLQAVWDDEAEDESSQADGSQQVLAQLAFYQSVRQVLENGMRMVGLVPMTM
jgi:arginyl-tRNA synthetase